MGELYAPWAHDGSESHFGSVFPLGSAAAQMLGSSWVVGSPINPPAVSGSDRAIYLSSTNGHWTAVGSDGVESDLEGGGGTAGAHNILSSTHSDSTAASVARGALVSGQGTGPVSWKKLALGASGQFLRSDGTDAAWSVIGATDIQHKVLSSTHQDSTAASAARGGLITGQGSPAASWALLTVGSPGSYLKADGTDVGWSALASDIQHTILSSTHTDTVAASVARGDLMTGQNTPTIKWKRLAIASQNTVLTSDGTDAAWKMPFTEVEVDLGGGTARSGTFAITDAKILTDSRVLVFYTANPGSGHTEDEAGMDYLTAAAVPMGTAGTARVYWSSVYGPVSGRYKFAYLIG